MNEVYESRHYVVMANKEAECYDILNKEWGIVEASFGSLPRVLAVVDQFEEFLQKRKTSVEKPTSLKLLDPTK